MLACGWQTPQRAYGQGHVTHFRPHRAALASDVGLATHRVLWSVGVCWSVCWSRSWALQKTAALIEMPFWGWLMWAQGSMYTVLGGVQGRTNPFADARGDKIVMRPFIKILWWLVTFWDRVLYFKRIYGHFYNGLLFFSAATCRMEIIRINVCMHCFCQI